MFDRDQIDELKLHFVTRQECDSTTDQIMGKIAHSDTELEVIKLKLSLIIGILSAVGLGILSLVIKQFWGA